MTESVTPQEVIANDGVQLPRPEAGDSCVWGAFHVPGELGIQGHALSLQMVLGTAGSTGHRPFGGVRRGDWGVYGFSRGGLSRTF